MSLSTLIIDGTAVAYRAFYAVQDLSTRAGQPTNALFGFIRMLQQLTATWHPDKLVVVFDGGSPAHRLAKCPEYKAQRAPMPDALRSQLPLLNEYLAAAGIPLLLRAGQEADDIMATLAVRAAGQGSTVRLATSDKDLMQLVSDNIRIVSPTKTAEELDVAGVEAKTGVRPEQIVDWLALVGDTADNIPGVHGIGPKTAAKLLQQYGSLAQCTAQLDSIEPVGVREKLRAGVAVAKLNVELMTLDTTVPDVPEWPDIAPPAPDRQRLLDFFNKFELHRFAAELSGDAPPAHKPQPKPQPKPPPKPTNTQLELF